MSATPSRLDLPARHRGRTARTEAVALAGMSALWGGGILAIVLVVLDWRPAVLVAIVVLLLVAGSAALAVARISIVGQTLEATIARLLQR